MMDQCKLLSQYQERAVGELPYGLILDLTLSMYQKLNFR